jgi:hypothetical protein
MQNTNLGIYSDIDPDALYTNNSITLLYIPREDRLWFEPYPASHQDMLYDDDIFADVFPGIKPEKRLRSRGQAVKHAILGRFGIYGGDYFLSFWNPLADHNVRKAIEAFFADFPKLNALYEKIIVTGMVTMNKPDKPVILADYMLSGSKPAHSDVSLQIDTPKIDKTIVKYTINGRMYSLADLQNMRASMHGKANYQHPVLCHSDMEKYPELKGYKPVNCDDRGGAFTKRGYARQVARDLGYPYMYSYGEWVKFRRQHHAAN